MERAVGVNHYGDAESVINFDEPSTFHSVFGENEGNMRVALFLLLALCGIICVGCWKEGSGEVQPPKSARNPAEVWTSDTRTLEDGSVITRTDKGTIIKSSGWQLPVALPNEKQYHATTVIIEGRPVKVLNSPFFPQEKLLVKFPRVAADGDAQYKVTQIIEFTDERKKPYCYQFFAEDDRPVYSGVTTYFSYRDDEGDGVFETLGQSCSVPAWVK
jgi:hypothetical protein